MFIIMRYINPHLHLHLTIYVRTTAVQVVLAVEDAVVSPQRLIVQAWTSQCDNTCADGSWHSVDLSYIGEERDTDRRVKHVYGRSDIITGDRDFEFTYRLKVNSEPRSTPHRGVLPPGEFNHNTVADLS